MSFVPEHLHASREDLIGNGGRGRYVLLPGSTGRAAHMAERLSERVTRSHPRGHDVHLGTWETNGERIDVATVGTGMGGPSVEIIVSELLALGARCLLRVGTCGSLQQRVAVGDLVIATGAVRDEGAGDAYLPREFPALASLSLVNALRRGAQHINPNGRTHCGVVHSKDSLYAREFAQGPLAEEHRRYRSLLTDGGVLASEMECATLFTMAAVADQAARTNDSTSSVAAGAILAVIGDAHSGFARTVEAKTAVEQAIDLAYAGLLRFHELPQSEL